jgi:glucosamine-6-phosphate deaminase
MRVRIHETAAEAAEETADLIAETLRARPNAVLGLATGGTMEPVYSRLIEEHRRGLSFGGATTFNLDEYVGLSPDHPQSYRTYMKARLFDHVDIDPSRTFIPRGDIDPARASEDYERLLSQHGPVDLQLLGLGHNGHIGFNEPTSSLASRTREKSLTRTTLEANSRFFRNGERQPESAITMGIGSIMESRRVVVLAVGASKADAVAAMIEGPVRALCPGSVLQFHPHVMAILDSAAASRLTLQDHYARAEVGESLFEAF